MKKRKPQKTEEEKRQIKAAENRAKLKQIREKEQQKQQSPKYIAKEQEKKRQELNAINNIRPNETTKQRNVREKFEKKGKNSIGTSSNNQKWEKIRKERYNERVWKGWREKDNQPSPVTTYKLSDLENGEKKS